MPATGATKNSVAVHGSSRSPASSGPRAEPVWRNWARKNTPQKSEPIAKKIAALPAENARERKKRIGSIGARRAQLPGDEGDQQRRAGDEPADDLGAAPAREVAAHEAPDEPEHAAGDEHEPAQVERGVGAEALRQPRQRERHERQAERHVEPEDPLPGEALGDRAADERPARHRQAR